MLSILAVAASVAWPLATVEWVRCKGSDHQVEIHTHLDNSGNDIDVVASLEVRDPRLVGGSLNVRFDSKGLVSFREIENQFDFLLKQDEAGNAAAIHTELYIATSGQSLLDDAFYYAGTYRVTLKTPPTETTPAGTLDYSGTVHCSLD